MTSKVTSFILCDTIEAYLVSFAFHEGVMTCKRFFLYYWPFLRGNSPATAIWITYYWCLILQCRHTSTMVSQITGYLSNGLCYLPSEKRSKLCITIPCEGKPSVAGGFPIKRPSNSERVFISWRHDVNRHLWCHGQRSCQNLWNKCGNHAS